MSRNLILQSRLSKNNVALNPVDKRDTAIRIAAEQAMYDYAVRAIDLYKTNQAKAVNKEAVGLIPSIVKGELRLWLRNWYFKRAKSEAIKRAEIENRKIYVIRSSDIAYKTFSTKDVDLNKRLKIFGKQVNAMTLTDTADYVASPKPKVIKREYVRNVK